MSIVKDLLLIAIFLFVVIKYVFLSLEMQRQRDYFIKTLNHDFKVSILAQLRGIELVQKGAGNKELISNIQDSCKYTLDMLNILINTYRYKNGEEVLNFEYINLKEEFKNIIWGTYSKLLDKNIVIKPLFGNNIDLYADKIELNKILQILLNTALDYAQKDSKIFLKVNSSQDKTSITINYQGKTLSEEERNRMFCKNPRFSTVGHGIKMYFCKKIVDFHNGKIKVYSNNDENFFTIVLPRNMRVKAYESSFLKVINPFLN